MHSQNFHNWEFPENDREQVAEISKKLHIDPVVTHIIFNRGIKSEKSVRDFLDPKLSLIEKEFCPIGTEKAIDRIIEAIKKKENIIVFGDYDADGVTGTVVLLDALKNLGANVEYYVPYRYTEGYGLNPEAIHKFKSDGITLVITVDCGISNINEITLANELGIDVIITDHHTPPAKLPPAVAIVNPKCEHDSSSKYLAGVGVAYKFIYYLYKKFRNIDIIKNKKYLELVAIGTITDVVPLLGDNRIFVKNGIEKMNRETSLGLHYLLEYINSNEINTTTIGFGIGPRINAAGRLESASLAIDLLLSKNSKTAKDLAYELNNLNEKRKKEGENIFLEAIKDIEQNPDILKKKVFVLSSDIWEPGVIGIVASQLAKHYKRPVVLITTKGKICRGSIRSFAGINVFYTLEQCNDLLLSYGGHAEAAGFEIDKNKIETFKEMYIRILDAFLEVEDLYSVVRIDSELEMNEITHEFYDQLKKLEPYGEGNREPIFLTRNMNAIDYNLVGKDRSHLKVLFIQGSEQIEAIGFKMASYLGLLDKYSTFDVAYNLSTNYFNGEKTLQLKLVDIKPSETYDSLDVLSDD
ncbi:MAG: single-stranded-DNA-specific exonuclease RecJ [Candidatus Margulisbacteria bacterium GWF2_35_9]|nr:MAG: single-stranded-DNA-specific exonuclease RecJ [Candidatus Margulisbacteria bacterium GWF2_35_9]